MGVSPCTTTVSATPPTLNSALIVIAPAPLIATPSRLTVLNPESEKVTE